jgi:hypothetical protein
MMHSTKPSSPVKDFQHAVQPYLRGHPPPLHTPPTFVPLKKPRTQLDR